MRPSSSVRLCPGRSSYTVRKPQERATAAPAGEATTGIVLGRRRSVGLHTQQRVRARGVSKHVQRSSRGKKAVS